MSRLFLKNLSLFHEYHSVSKEKVGTVGIFHLIIVNTGTDPQHGLFPFTAI